MALYNAFTFDTSTFVKHGASLTSLTFSQLDFFGQTEDFSLVISEVTEREVRKHLTEAKKVHCDKLKGAARSLLKTEVLDDNLRTNLQKVVDDMPTPQQLASHEFDEFTKRTNLVIVPSSYVDTDELVKSYFEGASPFGVKDKKKEFPDAIALFSLREWAACNNRLIAAVSEDGDWKGYDGESDRIAIVPDLSAAIANFQDVDNRMATFIRQSIIDAQDKRDSELAEDIYLSISGEVSVYNPNIEYNLEAHGEVWFPEFELQSWTINSSSTLGEEISLTKRKNDWYVASVPITMSVEADVPISTSIYDSVDRDMVDIGTIEVNRVIEVEANMVVGMRLSLDDIDQTKDGTFSGDPDFAISIGSIELERLPKAIDLGNLEAELDTTLGRDEG